MREHDKYNSLELPKAEPRRNRPAGCGLCSPCEACRVRPLTICSGLSVEDVDQLERIVTRITVKGGEPIFDEGEPASHRYIVTVGCVKIYKLLGDGRRQIIGFLFPGDFLGLAVEHEYAYSAEAVSESDLCRFSRAGLEDVIRRFPAMENRLLGMTSNELAVAQDQMVLLGRKSAKEKVATMLLVLSRRAVKRGMTNNPIAMPMTRADIGDYLGLTTETVSRTFTQLKTQNLISLEPGNQIRLKDIDALVDLTEGF